MDSSEVLRLVQRCLPSFHQAGLPPLQLQDIADVKHKAVASLWAGMGAVFEITIASKTSRSPVSIMVKRVELPAQCSSIGDQRKKDSYAVEAAFYSQGHAQRLIAAGACVPRAGPRRSSARETAGRETEGVPCQFTETDFSNKKLILFGVPVLLCPGQSHAFLFCARSMRWRVCGRWHPKV